MVQVNIYDILGQNIRTLINNDQEAGYHSVEWDGKNNMGQLLSIVRSKYLVDGVVLTKTKHF